jgi:hypothetical protein
MTGGNMSDEAEVVMPTLEPTWGRTIRIWWAWVWRVALWALVLNVGFGFVLGLMGIWETLSPTEKFYWSTVMGSISGVGLQLIILKRILVRDFGEFKLLLIARTPRRGPS